MEFHYRGDNPGQHFQSGFAILEIQYSHNMPFRALIIEFLPLFWGGSMGDAYIPSELAVDSVHHLTENLSMT